MNKLTLLKVGGAELRQGPVLDQLVAALIPFIAERDLVIVHGGGADIERLQRRLGLQPRFLDGLRVTDEESLQVAEMVLSGVVNKRLTRCLVAHGVRAIGISGVDAGLLRAQRLVHPKGDLGYVGEITDVDGSCLSDLLAQGFTPVVSPVSLGLDGMPLNVNADHAALAIASALHTGEMIFLTDVPGVMRGGVVLQALGSDEAERLLEDGHVTGGMIPKVRSALRAILGGVDSVRITNLPGLASGSGTWLLDSPSVGGVRGERKGEDEH